MEFDLLIGGSLSGIGMEFYLLRVSDLICVNPVDGSLSGIDRYGALLAQN